jgi:hypothetical protein
MGSVSKCNEFIDLLRMLSSFHTDTAQPTRPYAGNRIALVGDINRRYLQATEISVTHRYTTVRRENKDMVRVEKLIYHLLNLAHQKQTSIVKGIQVTLI